MDIRLSSTSINQLFMSSWLGVSPSANFKS
jgi:hypothetical protein